ncbi:MAG: tetratricopeptide repeat protein [Planctomycetota bacterium]
MSKKKAARKSKPKQLEVIQEPIDDPTAGEKALEAIQPYASTIILAIVAGVLGFFVVAYYFQADFQNKALEWRELTSSTTIALNTGDVSTLREVSDQYPEKKAGLWASQIAGDFQMRMGLQQMTTDRETALGLIEKAKDSYSKVKAAPASAKSSMLQRRSQFALAYAHESLGEFEAAQALYQELVEQAPDWAFADSAKRGLARTKNPAYSDFYERFVSWKDEMGDAPGLPVPERPSIEFPDLDLPSGTKPGEATDSGLAENATESPAVEEPKTETSPAESTGTGAPEKTDASQTKSETESDNKLDSEKSNSTKSNATKEKESSVSPQSEKAGSTEESGKGKESDK